MSGTQGPEKGWPGSHRNVDELADEDMLGRCFCDLEQGRRKPTWETVLALANALGVDFTAFTTEPAAEAGAPRRRGRPRKESKGKREE